MFFKISVYKNIITVDNILITIDTVTVVIITPPFPDVVFSLFNILQDSQVLSDTS